MSKMSLSFRAQSLDNLTPDPMERDGKALEDQKEREIFVEDISRVSINGSQVRGPRQDFLSPISAVGSLAVGSLLGLGGLVLLTRQGSLSPISAVGSLAVGSLAVGSLAVGSLLGLGGLVLLTRAVGVSRDGSRVHPDPDGRITVITHRDEFILEIDSDRKDSAGRIAPIICYGLLSDEAQPDAIVKAIQGFAGRIGRGVSDEDASSAQRVLEELVKKNTGAWKKLKNVLIQI